eukprot:1063082-Amphidinium_carterae.1
MTFVGPCVTGSVGLDISKDRGDTFQVCFRSATKMLHPPMACRSGFKLNLSSSGCYTVLANGLSLHCDPSATRPSRASTHKKAWVALVQLSLLADLWIAWKVLRCFLTFRRCEVLCETPVLMPMLMSC